ncbi:MAG: methyltransferase domain-containing protein [Acidobacteria bacterium]|nr:methyltransferase domain-containing protein [Acidobacteriota bacterium]
MAEFTGERVIAGQVDPDLFNEHISRYVFAARLARNKRVLDIACGTGYGSAELAAVARSVVGIDVSLEAVEYAQGRYQAPNLIFEVASAEQLPFADSSFDLITGFEVIEHLNDPRKLVSEARRLLTPAGQFVVSTPNRLYYEETRRLSGPNPFHTREFEFDEFRALLMEFFPHTLLFVQNHSDTIVFQPCETSSATEVRTAANASTPSDGHFFVAVCASMPQMGAPTFVYVPATANVLKEREMHIALLECELRQKNEWLDKSTREHEELVVQHRAQTEELEARNQWAGQLNRDLEATGKRVVEVQEELAAEQKAGKETAAAYEATVAGLESDLAARTQWAQETEARLSNELKARCEELAKCVELLHHSEAALEERTRWALQLQKQVDALQAQLSAVSASRWYRMGRSLGLGPELRQS